MITNPFAIINVIHSGLMRELGRHYRISVMSDLLTDADIALFNTHFQLRMELLPFSVPTIPKPLKWLRTIEMLLFGHYFNLETIRIKLMERSSFAYLLFRISRNSIALIFLSGTWMIILRNWLIRRTTLPDIGASVAEYGFQAVISTSPLDLRENIVVNSLKPRGITSISIIISWDNLTSKGVINSKSDVVLVWNKPMALEYERFYTTFGDNARVCITGVPKFDIYFRASRQSSHRLKDILGIDPQTRIILFATCAVKHHSCQNYMIEDLLEYAQSRPDTMILVRCHPGDDHRRYDRFSRMSNLRFFQPFNANGSQVPPVDFLEMLCLQLTDCDVCIQVASTMLLDALACNKPCISIAYDAHSGKRYAGSVKRFYHYSHQQQLPHDLKEQVVYHRRELFEKLDQVLEQGYAPNDYRNTVKTAIRRCAPDSVRLTARYIREWLD